MEIQKARLVMAGQDSSYKLPHPQGLYELLVAMQQDSLLCAHSVAGRSLFRGQAVMNTQLGKDN